MDARLNVIGVLILASAASSCQASPEGQGQVTARYDPTTGKLSQLTIDAKLDGKPNIFSYMNGSKFIRIEIDKDEDGRIDRWEYYNAGQGLEKVGISRLNDGIEDAWIFASKEGAVSRIEIATKRDRVIYRTEFYEAGKLSRVEEDTNRDGRLDRWETYEADQLATVSFDASNSGKPTVTVDYRKTAR